MPMKTTLEIARKPSPGSNPSVGGVEARKIAEPLARDDELRDDLARGEIAHQLLRAGMAESAVERAADLARNAERAAVALGNIDAFDLGAPVASIDRGEPEQPFAGAVGGDLLVDDLRPRQSEMVGEPVRAVPCRY